MTEILRQRIQQWTKEAGFELSGIVPIAAPDFPELRQFQEWIDAGYAGEMDYLKRQNEQGELLRSGLRNVLPWARSLIVCALNYNTAQPLSIEAPSAQCGWISRYAWSGDPHGHGTDYHEEVIHRLRIVESRFRAELRSMPGLQTRCYVDTGPILERVYATHAGIGWIGKNTCVINQKIGSWIFLGAIVTSMDLSEGENAPMIPPPDRCGTCTRCIDACPTNAIFEPHKLDATRCISYLTIEKRGTIEAELRPAMGRHVFGCDICQDVCPWNRRAPATTTSGLLPRIQLVNPPLQWLASLSQVDFQHWFRNTPVKRAKYSGFRRNVAIAMGNAGDRGFRPTLQEWAESTDEPVADAAKWALALIDRNSVSPERSSQALMPPEPE